MTGEARESQLNDAADSLLSHDAQVIRRKSGDCVTLARSPSCVEVFYLSGDLGLGAREDATVEAARDNEWSLVKEDRAAGGSAFVFRRGNMRATVELWADPKYERCLAAPSADCADFIRVDRR